MFKSLSAGIVVALAFPFGWLLLWLLGFVSLGLPLREHTAVGLGAVAGRMAQMLILGSLPGLITALLLYIFHFRKA